MPAGSPNRITWQYMGRVVALDHAHRRDLFSAVLDKIPTRCFECGLWITLVMGLEEK